MKKALSIISLIITFLIIYFLQSNFFTWFNLAGVKPNLFVVFALFIGLFLGKAWGTSVGVISGFLIDLLIGEKIGVNAIVLGSAGFLRRWICKKFF